MNSDEFKAAKDTKCKMDFSITISDKGTLFDIRDSRKYKTPEKCFKRYSKKMEIKLNIFIVIFILDTFLWQKNYLKMQIYLSINFISLFKHIVL